MWKKFEYSLYETPLTEISKRRKWRLAKRVTTRYSIWIKLPWIKISRVFLNYSFSINYDFQWFFYIDFHINASVLALLRDDSSNSLWSRQMRNRSGLDCSISQWLFLHGYSASVSLLPPQFSKQQQRERIRSIKYVCIDQNFMKKAVRRSVTHSSIWCNYSWWTKFY